MISPIIEKLLLRGDAQYSIFTHAYGMIGRIPVPNGKVAVITKITWFPFCNPIDVDLSAFNWTTMLKYNEYMLRLKKGEDSVKFVFRNNVKINTSGAFNFQYYDPIDFENIVIQNGDPVIEDCFIVATTDIELSITRSMARNFTTTYGLFNPLMSDNNQPNGVQNVPGIRLLEINGAAGTPMYYYPGGASWAGLTATNNRSKDEYNPETRSADAFYRNSEIMPPSDFPQPSGEGYVFPFAWQPLVNFEVIYINESASKDLRS